MRPLEGLRWTTRREVCAELIRCGQALSEAPGSSSDLMLLWQVPKLFALVAEDTHIPILRGLLLHGKDAQWECREALVRLKARLPADELKALLEEEHERGGWCNFGLFAELFSAPEAQKAAREAMESWTPAGRARTLVRIGWHDSLRGLADWLYERWLNEERWELEGVEDREGPLNRTVAWHTAKSLKRLESKAILLDYWRRSEGETRADLRDRLWDFDEGVPAAWVADHPQELQELAESFALTHADLVTYYGADRLLQLAEDKLREISRRLRAEPDDDSPVQTMEFERLVTMLVDWPEPGVQDRIRSLMACPDTATEVRWAFCDSLWEERREEMSSLTLAAGQLAGDRALVTRVLRWLADEAQPSDRPLLWWAAFQEADWELPYWAMQGLEQLGECSDRWHERLKALSRSSHPFLRLQACGALARRGDRGRVPGIARSAAEDKDPCARGEAIRVLGQLRSVEHLDLICQALWAQEPIYKADPASMEASVPVAEEAALALGRIGTPEALIELLRGFLLLPPWPHGAVRIAVENALEAQIARMDGKNCPFTTLPCVGWRWDFFRPWPEPSFKLSE